MNTVHIRAYFSAILFVAEILLRRKNDVGNFSWSIEELGRSEFIYYFIDKSDKEKKASDCLPWLATKARNQ